MDSGPTLKPKVTVKLNYDRAPTSTRPPSRGQISSRPASPVKSYVSLTNTDTNFRPKAKVNTSATTRKAAGGSTVSVSNSATSTPRSGSPAKLTPRVRNGVVSPSSSVTRGTLRSPPPVTPSPGTAELRRTVVQTQSASSSLRTEDSRSRTNSTSLHHTVSFSSFRPSSSSVVSGSTSVSASSSPRLLSAKSTLNLVDRSQTSSPTPRIRSKVSNVAKVALDPLPPQPPSPTNSVSPSTRPTTSPRTRAPSVSSSINQIYQHQYSSPPTSPPQQFYPITTAVSAANPHRFATSRPPTAPRNNGSPGHHVFQSFSQQSSSSQGNLSSSPSASKRPRSAGGLLNLNGSTAMAKVDPASIPLPPHSPSASAVSFSSRSSASRSSANAQHLGGDSHMSDGGGHTGPGTRYQGDSESLRETLDNLMHYTSGDNSTTDDDDGDSGLGRGTDGEVNGVGKEHKVKAAAKSNRKIADLEITNRSLLVINASLEATKHRQAKEIHELRRKLRESRLILPPRAYRALTSQDPADVEDDEDEDEPEVDETSDAEDVIGDETYKRVKMILDTLLVSGKAALETQKEDFSERNSGVAKVLSPEEQRDYHETNETDQDDVEPPSTTQSTHIPPGSDDDIGLDQDVDYNNFNDGDTSFDDVGNETMTSEDEVEAMTISALSPPSSPHPPPILISQPT